MISPCEITYLLSCSWMLLQSAAIRAKKLLVEIGLLGIVCKVSSRKTLSVETFWLSWKTFAVNIKSRALINLLIFMSCRLANTDNHFSWNVFLTRLVNFVHISGPGYSCHTVILVNTVLKYS